MVKNGSLFFAVSYSLPNRCITYNKQNSFILKILRNLKT